ncbi:hypothetical protein C8R43DRAFT_1110596 [Mycena crocata]|nr:hypothetical protein C8R43DRAFT_1110596 [Mycena crocata]
MVLLSLLTAIFTFGLASAASLAAPANNSVDSTPVVPASNTSLPVGAVSVPHAPRNATQPPTNSNVVIIPALHDHSPNQTEISHLNTFTSFSRLVYNGTQLHTSKDSTQTPLNDSTEAVVKQTLWQLSISPSISVDSVTNNTAVLYQFKNAGSYMVATNLTAGAPLTCNSMTNATATAFTVKFVATFQRGARLQECYTLAPTGTPGLCATRQQDGSIVLGPLPKEPDLEHSFCIARELRRYE